MFKNVFKKAEKNNGRTLVIGTKEDANMDFCTCEKIKIHDTYWTANHDMVCGGKVFYPETKDNYCVWCGKKILRRE